ncbi:MAG: hypothetical protein DI573_09070 [Microbacterium sp.]|nr:MAG: hypothetical protein DI573_09070 [Microbacterium sp.]
MRAASPRPEPSGPARRRPSARPRRPARAPARRHARAPLRPLAGRARIRRYGDRSAAILCR